MSMAQLQSSIPITTLLKKGDRGVSGSGHALTTLGTGMEGEEGAGIDLSNGMSVAGAL